MAQSIPVKTRGRSGKKGGKKNLNKSAQPKRQRYVLSKRGYKRRVAALKRHIARHPNDRPAPDTLERLRVQWGLA